MNTYLTIFNETDNNDFKTRRNLVAKFSWAIPNDEALDIISKLGDIVEIGAGSAYWAHLLQDRGVNILPVDKYLDNNTYGHTKFWTDVYDGDESILDKLSEDVNLFLCWPPYADPMAYNCLMKFKGEYIIYIGEIYGCTGDEDFHDELYENWEEIVCYCIPQWHGPNDCLYVFKRK